MKYNFKHLKEMGVKVRNKSETAKLLGISRPTLDLWLKKFKRDEHLIQDECGQRLLLLEHGLGLRDINPDDVIRDSENHFKQNSSSLAYV